MTQVWTKHVFDANYGQAVEWVPLVGGNGDFGTMAFDATQARHPWSCAGVLQNLVLQVPTAVGWATTWTVLLNGVATPLTVTLGAAATYAADLIHTVTVAPGDDLALELAAALLHFPGFNAGYSIEFAGTTPGESGYGIAPFAGTCTLSNPSQVARIGGALGNGIFQFSPVTVSALSNTYSIVSAAGSLTRLDLATFSGAPGAGIWTGALVKNAVLQDGSGGTVDTRAVITGAATKATALFDLPVVEADHVDVYVGRSGTSALFAVAHVGASVAFVATDPDVSLLCGGSNNATTAAFVDYQWNGAEQERPSEGDAANPVGPTGFTVRGLYIERGHAPFETGGQAWIHTLRQSGVDTALVVTVADHATTGVLLTDVAFVDGETINLAITPVATPHLGQLHWGLALSTAVPTPPPPTPGVVYATRRLRQFRLPSDPDGRWLQLRALDVLLQAGIGNAVDPGADPQVMLQISRDGGRTWGPERWRSAGRRGATTTRTLILHAGRYREGAVRLVVTDPVPWRFLQASGVIDPGTS